MLPWEPLPRKEQTADDATTAPARFPHHPSEGQGASPRKPSSPKPSDAWSRLLQAEAEAAKRLNPLMEEVFEPDLNAFHDHCKRLERTGVLEREPMRRAALQMYKALSVVPLFRWEQTRQAVLDLLKTLGSKHLRLPGMDGDSDSIRERILGQRELLYLGLQEEAPDGINRNIRKDMQAAGRAAREEALKARAEVEREGTSRSRPPAEKGVA